MRVDLPAPLSPRTQVISPGVDVEGDALQGPDVAVVLADVAQLDERPSRMSVVHLTSARLRTHPLSSVASSSITPRKNLNQSGFHCA